MKYLLFAICITLSASSIAQTKKEPQKVTKAEGPVGIEPGIVNSADTANSKKVASEVFMYVEQMPSTGYDMNTYVSENLKYPVKARNKGIQGRVIVQFVVNEDGSVSDAKVLRGIGSGCDEEALRVINTMPKWLKPGKQNGKTVKVLFTQPLSFKLE